MTRFFLDEKLVAASRLLAGFDGDSETSVENYAYAKNRDTDQRKAIQTLLNFYEAVAVGIKNDIYDEQIVKDCQGTIIVGVWRFSEPFVKRLRSENRRDSLYEHLERLACKLEDSGVNPPAQMVGGAAKD